MLQLVNVHAYYAHSHILRGVSLEVNNGSIVAVLGRNGMGKTTIIRSIIGFVPRREGAIRFKGRDITLLEPHRIARMGIALVPQGRRIFPSLSVKENLTMPARVGGKNTSWSLEKVYSLFPILKERSRSKGNLLSGGEQQMLSIGRALMTNPDLLLMDEPSEGLAPLVVKQISSTISELRGDGLSILLVEQNLPMALAVADYIYIVRNGQIVHESRPEDLRNNEEAKAHLGVRG